MVKQKIIKKSGTLGYGAGFATLDKDSYEDLVGAESGGLRLYYGSKKGKFSSPHLIAQGLSFSVGFLNGSSSIGYGDVNKDKKIDLIGLQHFTALNSKSPDDYNIMLMLNGQKPASLSISDLQITNKQFVILLVNVTGSFAYSGSGIQLTYKEGGTSPTQHAFFQMRIFVNFPFPWRDVSIRLKATGEFLNQPGSESGRVSFNLAVPAGVSIFGNISPTITISDIYLWDANLVRSNELDE